MLAGVSQQVILKHLESREILLVSGTNKILNHKKKREGKKKSEQHFLTFCKQYGKNKKGIFKETKNCFVLLILK